MAFYDGVKIATNGLILCLDAADRNSFLSGNSTWIDISGNNNNATLINSPSFSTSNGGIITFSDTSFQYATIPNIGSLSVYSIETWCRVKKSLTNKVTSVITNQYDLVSNLNFSIGTNRAPTSYNMSFGFFNGSWRNVNGFSASLNIWYHLIGTYDGSTLKFYANGILDTQLVYSGTPQSGGEIRIARRWDDVANVASNFFDGDIANVKIYNRALSETEIIQNYNVTKSRFGL